MNTVPDFDAEWRLAPTSQEATFGPELVGCYTHSSVGNITSRRQSVHV
jgi:hypothetical protein